jgi:hypothetical protein
VPYLRGYRSCARQDLLDLMDALRLQTALLSGAGARPRHRRRLQHPEHWLGRAGFHTERGRAGLTKNRDALCKLLWQLRSPSWNATYQPTAVTLGNAAPADDT